MDRIQTRSRGPEWKQGWTDQTLASISAPPLPLVAIFAIVIFLLSLSQYSNYKEQMHYTMVYIKLLLLLVPVLLIFFLRSGLLTGVGLDFWSSIRPGPRGKQELGHGSSGFPWAVAVLLVVILVLRLSKCGTNLDIFGTVLLSIRLSVVFMDKVMVAAWSIFTWSSY